MLPGFRLLAIIVAIAASMLIFGLGTAALLRGAHQEFAAVPLRNLQTPAPNFVAETPTLAVLQVEPTVEEQAQPAPAPESHAAPAPEPAPAPAPPAQSETTRPDDEVVIPLVIIPDPPSIPLTDATVTASVERQPPADKPAAAPAAAIKTRPVARKRAAIRARARARHHAHHYRRRIVRPAPPPPVEPGFFSLFSPAPATATTTPPTVASTLPPRR